MKYKIIVTRKFEKDLKKLTYAEQRQVASKLKILQNNPLYPSLRTKRIKGFDVLFECSINMDIRILWQYKGEDIIITIDVGHHSLVDRL